MAVLWRDHGPEMGAVDDPKQCRRMVSFHGGRCGRFLKVRRQAAGKFSAGRADRSFAHGGQPAAPVGALANVS